MCGVRVARLELLEGTAMSERILKADVLREQLVEVVVPLTEEQGAAYDASEGVQRRELLERWAVDAAKHEWFEAETLSVIAEWPKVEDVSA